MDLLPTSGGAAAEARRDRLARAWDLASEVVVIPSGLPVPIAGTDLFHDFHAHAEHYYLSGLAQARSVLVFDPGEGWTLFAYQPPAAEAVWTGPGPSLEEVRVATGLDDVRPLPGLQTWLEARRGHVVAVLGNDDITDHPEGYGLTSWRGLELAVDGELGERLSDRVSEARRAKDRHELAHMRAAATASHHGHMAGLRLARPGMTERDLQVEIEAEFFRAGSERTAYGSIVGGGPHAATLHFSPGGRTFQEGDLILVDAGAEYRGYASDVTRTYPVGASFEGLQRDLYGLVLDVQEHAIANVRPGKEYRDLHLDASLQIAAGLADLDILRGGAQGLVEADAQALFFPHGLGHMLGLATHDAGGCLAGREQSDRPTLRFLRADLPLEPGYVVTIEPGVYFIRAILEDPEVRERHAATVNWDRVEGLLDFGGIRIEDDVLVTGTGAEVLSGKTPKQLREIEELRREALAR